jgi:hypothetical protein
MSGQAISSGTSSATSSPGSASGATPCAAQAGPTTGQSGPAPAPASLSPRQAKEAGLLTSGTCGLIGSISSSTASRAASLSLASRLRRRTDLLGSTLFTLIWKDRVTPSGRSIYALRASARRTSDNASTSWPTPTRQDGASSGAAGYSTESGRHSGTTLTDAARYAGWPTPLSAPSSEASHNQVSGQWRAAMEKLPACDLGHADDEGPQGRSVPGAVGSGHGAGERAAGAAGAADNGMEHSAGSGREVALQHGGSSNAAQEQRQANVHRSGGATGGYWRDADWLPCIDGKARPVEPGTFPLAHGTPARVGRLRAYGNAIVAPLAEEFIRAYLAESALSDLL